MFVQEVTYCVRGHKEYAKSAGLESQPRPWHRTMSRQTSGGDGERTNTKVPALTELKFYTMTDVFKKKKS